MLSCDRIRYVRPVPLDGIALTIVNTTGGLDLIFSPGTVVSNCFLARRFLSLRRALDSWFLVPVA